MFQKAYEIASNYTSPLILAYRFFDKTVDSGLGSFIILNDDGWLMTAAHNLQAAIAFNQHKPELADYYERVDKISQDAGLNSTQIETGIKEIKANDKWLTHLLVWVGANGAELLETVIYGEHDIAFLRIDSKSVQVYANWVIPFIPLGQHLTKNIVRLTSLQIYYQYRLFQLKGYTQEICWKVKVRMQWILYTWKHLRLL
jgi:hypothetical protein